MKKPRAAVGKKRRRRSAPTLPRYRYMTQAEADYFSVRRNSRWTGEAFVTVSFFLCEHYPLFTDRVVRAARLKHVKHVGTGAGPLGQKRVRARRDVDFVVSDHRQIGVLALRLEKLVAAGKLPASTKIDVCADVALRVEVVVS